MKYPGIKVKLIGMDGNAFAVLGRVVKAMRKAGVSEKQIKEFRDEAMNGDYGHLLSTVMNWVDVE